LKTVIVLAMHGTLPRDLPRELGREFFAVRGRLEQAPEAERAALRPRYNELDSRLRSWPRTAANDPYHAASQEMADHLSRATGDDVIAGFNEFCGPSLDQAMDEAVARGAARVVVVTPMVTRGGEHAEKEIAAIVDAARARHPGVAWVYAWPYPVSEVAQFLAAQISRFIPANPANSTRD
jgi:sirohydrochlorin cobaltochelatase